MPDTNTTLNLILFISVITLMTIVYPIAGYYQSKRLRDQMVNRVHNRSIWYISSIIWSWIPTLIITATVLISGFSMADLGFVTPSEQTNEIPKLLFYGALAGALIYFAYSLYCIITFRVNNKVREEHADKISAAIKMMLPVSLKEKRVWTLLSISAGITEEINYRGYLFLAIPLLFPRVGGVAIIAISSLLFAIGHIYQGKEAYKPALAGVAIGTIFYLTGSIYPVIIIHIAQDLVAKELLKEES
ncbi:MAG: CPBP family intramembrane metalloprotease [Bacteroidales bacterium]|jgi:membrane protease YdiL (CAAX protease family)|nr:CPBP family intramembrane metalloprotease [Bacteroidales bacterium]